jgi:hypothetical protein
MTSWAKSTQPRFSVGGKDAVPGPGEYDPKLDAVLPRTLGAPIGTADWL